MTTHRRAVNGTKRPIINSTEQEFRTYFKNICGRDLLHDAWVDETLETLFEKHYDALGLADLGQGGGPLSPTHADRIMRYVNTWTPSTDPTGLDPPPFCMHIATDLSGHEKGRGSVGLILRAKYNPEVRLDPGGRWLHAQILTNGARAVHLEVAYPKHYEVPSVDDPVKVEDAARQAALLKQVEHLALYPARGRRCPECRQANTNQPCPQCVRIRPGPLLLMADANSVMDDRHRPGGRQLQGRDGPTSLAYLLQKRNFISPVLEQQKLDDPQSLHPQYTWEHNDGKKALLDLICIHGQTAHRRHSMRAGIDLAENVIGGSDHHGTAAFFRFKTMFGCPKSSFVAAPKNGAAAVAAAPKFSPAELFQGTHLLEKAEDDWSPQLGAAEAAVEAATNLEERREAMEHLVRCQVAISDEAFGPILTARPTSSRGKGLPGHLLTRLRRCRQLHHQLYGPSGLLELASSVNTDQAHLQLKLGTALLAWQKAHKATRRTTEGIPPPPNGLNLLVNMARPTAPQAGREAAIRTMVTQHRVAVEKALATASAAAHRHKANDQCKQARRTHDQWARTGKGFLDQVLNLRGGPVNTTRVEVIQAADDEDAADVDGTDPTAAAAPSQLARTVMSADRQDVFATVVSYFSEWFASSRDPPTRGNMTDEADAPTAEESPAPPHTVAWVEPVPDALTEDVGYRVVSDPTSLDPAARQQWEIARPRDDLPLGWADSAEQNWSLAELDRLIAAAAARNARGGPTGVTARVIHAWPTRLRESLVFLYNMMQTHGVVPKSLAHGSIQPLIKDPGKPSFTQSRPITLLNDHIKLFTKGLNERIQTAIRRCETEVLNPAQCAFLFDHNCLDGLWPLQAALEDAQQHNKPLHLLSIDLRRAYDSIEPWSLELAARRLKLPESVVRVLRDFDRQATSAVITAHGVTPPFRVERGVRQGDPLSPLRFVFFVDMLLASWNDGVDPYVLEPGADLETPGQQSPGQGYVDDLLLLSASRAGIENRAESLAAFMNTHGVTINTDKSLYIAVNHNEESGVVQAATPPPLYTTVWNKKSRTTSCEPFKYVPVDKPWRYLGVWFQGNLDFGYQHKRLTKALTWMLNTLKGHPLSPSMLVYAINAAVLPRMLWACQVALPSQELLRDWDEMIQKACNCKLRVDTPCLAADSLHLAPPLGLGLQKLSELAPALAAKNLTIALHATTGALANTTAARWEDPTSLVRTIAARAEQEMGITFSCAAPDLANRRPSLAQMATHLGAARPEDEISAALPLSTTGLWPPDTPLLAGTNLLAAFPSFEATQQTYIFTSDGSADNGAAPPTAGCSLVLLVSPPLQEWHGDATTILWEGNGPYRTPAGDLVQLPVRYTRLACVGMTAWPLDLVEAWPLLQALCSTPADTNVGLYIDNQGVIDQWNRYVLGDQVTRAHWHNRKEGWLWRHLIQPLYLHRRTAGGNVALYKIKSHAVRDGVQQDQAFNILSDTADWWANVGRSRQQAVSLDAIRTAVAAGDWTPDFWPTRPVGWGEPPSPLRLPVKTVMLAAGQAATHARVLTQATRGLIAALHQVDKDLGHPRADPVATRGATHWDWVRVLPTTPGSPYTLPAFAYRLRNGALNTLKTLVRRPGQEWLRDALTLQANEQNLDAKLRRTAQGADARCLHCKSQQADTTALGDIPHLLVCPSTDEAFQRLLARMGLRLLTIGGPGILAGQYDPSWDTLDDPHFYDHLALNEDYIAVSQHPDCAVVDCVDPSGLLPSVSVRADVYWWQWNAQPPDDGPATIRHLHSQLVESAERDWGMAPRRIPDAILDWFQQVWSLHTYMALGALPLDAPAGSWQCPFLAADTTVQEWRAHLRRTGGLVNLAGAPETAVRRFLQAAAHTFLDPDGDASEAVVGLLPVTISMSDIRKKGGRLLFRIPARRLPVVTTAEWLHSHTPPTRDAHWCTGQPLLCVLWEPPWDAAQPAMGLEHDQVHALWVVLTHELWGGAEGITLTHRGVSVDLSLPATATCTTHAVVFEAASYLGHWLSGGRPRTALSLPTPESGILAIIESSEYLALGRDKQPLDFLRTATGPAGLTSFLRTCLRTNSAGYESQGLVAELTAGLHGMWSAYAATQTTHVDALWAAAGQQGPAPAMGGGAPPRTVVHRLPGAASATRRLCRLPCQGRTCRLWRQRNPGIATPKRSHRVHLCTTTGHLLCTPCRVAGQSARLFNAMISILRFYPGVSAPSHVVWPTGLQEAHEHINQLPAYTCPREVASLAVLPLPIRQRLPQIDFLPDGGVSALLWLMHLRRQSLLARDASPLTRINRELQRLWDHLPPAERPKGAMALRWLRLHIVLHPRHSRDQDVTASLPTAPHLGCEGILCRDLYGDDVLSTRSAVTVDTARGVLACGRCKQAHTAWEWERGLHAAAALLPPLPLQQGEEGPTEAAVVQYHPPKRPRTGYQVFFAAHERGTARSRPTGQRLPAVSQATSRAWQALTERQRNIWRTKATHREHSGEGEPPNAPAPPLANPGQYLMHDLPPLVAQQLVHLAGSELDCQEVAGVRRPALLRRLGDCQGASPILWANYCALRRTLERELAAASNAVSPVLTAGGRSIHHRVTRLSGHAVVLQYVDTWPFPAYVTGRIRAFYTSPAHGLTFRAIYDDGDKAELTLKQVADTLIGPLIAGASQRDIKKALLANAPEPFALPPHPLEDTQSDPSSQRRVQLYHRGPPLCNGDDWGFGLLGPAVCPDGVVPYQVMFARHPVHHQHPNRWLLVDPRGTTPAAVRWVDLDPSERGTHWRLLAGPQPTKLSAALKRVCKQTVDQQRPPPPIPEDGASLSTQTGPNKVAKTRRSSLPTRQLPSRASRGKRVAPFIAEAASTRRRRAKPFDTPPSTSGRPVPRPGICTQTSGPLGQGPPSPRARPAPSLPWDQLPP